MDIIFKAKVEKNTLKLDEPEKMREYLKSLEGQIVQVIVRKIKKPRSLNQNAYMWGVVYQLISETTGYTIDEVHSAMGVMFLMDRSRSIPMVRSTTSLSTISMENYLESIRQWAAKDLNCVIPEPNQVDYKNSNEY